ncbi:MAG: MlaD family protein [Paludibacter sp.]|nr:MlaD family protein [Bacteroidales bacterium]MCM1069128.1 MlaD family protein [Prevotella sp.]MCM1353567.1 MlaD family protein [Bacteroides sp.]MCM1442728.1 MlaD family protein [Muribaculum sp.]MCM1481636.1 MlaD family protein [Paludibacter sp.]
MKKYAREIKVGLLAILAVFLLYFGFNFLKGVNIFSPTYTYCAIYSNVNGLTEQAPVYVRGYKVGQVDRIMYDFSQENAFCVFFSVDKHIAVPKGAECALVADGLLGGTALQLNLPLTTAECYVSGDTLPTIVVPGLMDALQDEVIAKLSGALEQVDSLLTTVNTQLQGNHLQQALEHVDHITADLETTAKDIRGMMNNQIPELVSDTRDAVADVKVFAANLETIDFAATVAKVDSTVNNLNTLTAGLNSTDGTLGLLLNDRQLYLNLTGTVASADSLLVDLKANPKRYVHFSLFGRKEKK